jgi:hypothetical protein
MYNGDYDYYEKEYNRHVAFSLAVVKAEDLFYDFVKRTGNYLLTRDERDKEAVQANLRELTNISELYQGHRLFVMYNIVRIYSLTVFSKPENLRSLEMEVDTILQQIKKNFDKYELDTFYQSIKFLVDYLYFEYYQKTGNAVRAEHYYKIINKDVPEVAFKPVFSFYVTQFLQSKVERYMQTSNITDLTDLNSELDSNFDVTIDEPYPYISFRRFMAISKFYEGDFSASARIINNLRNETSLKKFLYTDVEYKLFQAMQYCFMGEDGLCSQLLQSVKRQINDDDANYETATVFIKMLKTAIKPEEFRKKVKKLTEIYNNFSSMANGTNKMLWYVKMDEAMIRKMANPIKE